MAGDFSSEPFRTFAEKYLDIGKSIFPVNGKTPLVKWKALQSQIVKESVLGKWVDKYPGANIGVVTGNLSNLTVDDSDNPALGIEDLFSRYGETPIVITTPRGGHHLYYQHNGETSQQDDINKIDIKGKGGFVVAPPSFNHELGRKYDFFQGDMFEFHSLPKMIPQVVDSLIHIEGARNKSLFNHLIEAAHNITNIDELMFDATYYNNEYLSPPLSNREVEQTVRSVWRYKQEDRLFLKGKQVITLEMNRIEPLIKEYPNALALYCDLKSCHRNKNATFAISPKGYCKRLNMSDKTLAKARDVLLEHGIIECLHKGGKGKRDTDSYRLV